MKHFHLFVKGAMLLVSLILFTNCNKDSISSQEENYLFSIFDYYEKNVLVTISPCDNPFLGQSEDNCAYLIVTAKSLNNNDVTYSMYVEDFDAGGGVVVSKTFTQDLDLFSSSIFFMGKEVNTEFSDYSDDIETRASRQEGEKYKDCVKRVHKTIKDAAEENYGAQCDMVSLLVSCGTLAAICAVVECNEYGDDF